MRDTQQIEELLTACKKNNQSAQLKIYNLYYKAMFNTAYRIVNDFDDAEDVMQEAFIKAFQKLESFKQNSTFGAWLKRIVINEAIYWLRKKKKFVDIETLKQEVNTEGEQDLDFNKFEAQQVLKALSELKENYRIIISLHFLEGYDFEEIQQIMNISYANARTMLTRAKTKLKQKLIKEYGFVG